MILLMAVQGFVAACGGGEGTGHGTGPAASAGDAEGSVDSEPSPGVHGQAPPASGGVPAFVTVTPRSGAPDAQSADNTARAARPAARPAHGAEAVVDQFGLAFSPKVLVADAGSSVRFTNSEGAITHNVHLRSVDGDSTVFNGDTGPTEGVDVELPGPGGYDVLCDMHPGMTGFVFLTEAPYAVAAETDGSFRLGSVPPGEYLVRAWTVDGGWRAEQAVNVETDSTFLDLTTR